MSSKCEGEVISLDIVDTTMRSEKEKRKQEKKIIRGSTS